jgi:uncharacterized membrane protein YjjB (DUF3815 family)
MNDSILQILLWIKAPFFAAAATSAFSFLYGLHATDIFLASLGAALGRFVFQLVPASESEALAAFLAAMAAGLYSELVGYLRRRPATAYMISSIIPLVPGGGMYYTMLSTLEGDSMRSVELGLATLMTAFALAVGLAISNAGMRLFSIRNIVKKLPASKPK